MNPESEQDSRHLREDLGRQWREQPVPEEALRKLRALPLPEEEPTPWRRRRQEQAWLLGLATLLLLVLIQGWRNRQEPERPAALRLDWRSDRLHVVWVQGKSGRTPQ